VIATHATVKSVIRRVEELVHKLYICNFFSTCLDLFDDLHTQITNCPETIRQNCKGMPRSFLSKTLKLKQGDTQVSQIFIHWVYILKFQVCGSRFGHIFLQRVMT